MSTAPAHAKSVWNVVREREEGTSSEFVALGGALWRGHCGGEESSSHGGDMREGVVGQDVPSFVMGVRETVKGWCYYPHGGMGRQEDTRRGSQSPNH